MSTSLIWKIRNSAFFMRLTSGMTIFFFIFTFYSPSALAIKTDIEQTQQAKAAIEGKTAEEKLSNTLQAVKEHVKKNKDKITGRVEEEGGFIENVLDIFGLSTLATEDTQTLNQLNEDIQQLHEEALANFAAIEAQLKEKGLPEEILQRHYDAVAKYNAEYANFQAKVNQLNAAESLFDQEVAIEELDDFLDEQQFKRSHQPFDPNQLPNQSLKPNPDNKPKLQQEDFTLAGLQSTPYIQLAGLGDFTFENLPGADNPAYLAETVEVTLSDVINEKAAELNHDPVTIYHWVRNNITWQPTWGAVQDAELTLGSRRGNAFDIASLLIALLRVSGIPSRYVHGTIQVSADEFKNWAGGFTNIYAAAEYAASGGIPTAPIVSGGQITQVQIEHIWVEAAIDFHPSRGAINKDADSWIAMDPSYKQYELLEGLDPVVISDVDVEAVTQSFISSGTINETEGWVSSFDPTILETAQTEVQQDLEQHITDNLPNPTVDDVIGGRHTIIQEFPVFSSTLPNKVLAMGSRYDHIPSALQQKMTFAFGINVLGELNDPLTFPWAQLNNKKVTLSFRPASQTDEDALSALLPEGEITDISQLPTTIPSYLINAIPELKVEGEVVKSGAPIRLGEEIDFRFNPTIVGYGTIPKRYSVIAGSYLDVAVIAGSVSSIILEDLQAEVEDTRTILESGNPTLISGLDREDILGDVFYAGMLGYYAQYTSFAHTMGLQNKAYHYLAAGLGSLGYEPNVDYYFGIPRSINTGGLVLNIPIVNIFGIDSELRENRFNFTLQVGLLSSALEHIVPEQMFADEDNPPDAISAVKALGKANSEGQLIYHITQANQTSVLPNIHHNSLVMDEIRQSLATGKEVITHTDAVSVPGWTGAGYIIFDPITGDGAYKISGGTNGGFLLFLGALIFVLGLFFAANVTVLFALPLLVQGAIAFIAGFLSALSEFGLKFLESATVFRLLAAYIALLVVGELIAIQVLLGALLFFLLTFVLI